MKNIFDNMANFEDIQDQFDDFEQAIPLMSEEEEKELTQSEVPDELPILPLKNTVLFRVSWFPLQWAETVP